MPFDDLLHPLPLVSAAEQLSTVDASVLARHIEDALQRAHEREPSLRVMTLEAGRAERLRTAANDLSRRFPTTHSRPPLFGVLVGIKDIIAVDGLPMRAGSALPRDEFEMPEASVVRRLREAGAIVFGKTVTAEFASMGTGPTANPHGTTHTPGGSSSGSAAGVAAGYFPLALGTQTAGSVIRPAAFCGIVGFKPSYGRIPTDGVLAHAPSVDTLGTFTQDVEGAVLAASVLIEDWREPLPPPAASLVCGVPDGAYLDLADDAGREAFEATVARLADAGVEVHRVPFLEDVREVLKRQAWMQDAEFARTHEDRFARLAPLFSGGAAAQVDRGRRVTAEQYHAGIEGRRELRDRLHTLMDTNRLDTLLCPAAPGPAPLGLSTTGDPKMNTPWTHAGVPAVTLPAGLASGLPVGLQLVGRFGADEELLQAASALAPLL